MLYSCDFKAPSCPGNGSFSFGGNGQYTEVILGRDRPKLTSAPGRGRGLALNNRAAVSAEEYKGIGQGTVKQFGTWSVDEASKTLTLHSENTFTLNCGRQPGSRIRILPALTTAQHFVLDELKLAAAMGTCSAPALELGNVHKEYRFHPAGTAG
jgi:hypothetical protein